MDMDEEVTQAQPEVADTAAAPSATPLTPVASGSGQPAIEIDQRVWVPERGKSRMRTGRVVSNKMDKTVVVAVDRLVRHPLYKKTIRRTNKFVAHDELHCQEGDVVRILETRPISKTKRWRVVEVVSRAVPL